MPFLSEELWQRLVKKGAGVPESLCLAAYPRPNPALHDEAAGADFALLREMTVEQRALRADNKIDPKQKAEAVLYARDDRAARLLAAQLPILERLANTAITVGEGALPGGAARSKPEFDVLLKMGGAQADAMRVRLEKEIEQLTKVIDSSKRQLGSESFVAKAPAQVVEGLKTKLADYETQLAKSRESLAALD
jgi:valyl-tRNA synthetase